MTTEEKATLFQDFLIRNHACEPAREWAGDMTIEEVVATCHRGDWLLWLADVVGVEKRLMVLAAGLCANTVRHLMQDGRSRRAVDVCISFGKGEATEEELAAAEAAAWDAAWGAAWDAWAAWAAWAAAEAEAEAEAEAASPCQTADIVREVMGTRIIELVNNHLQSL